MIPRPYRRLLTATTSLALTGVLAVPVLPASAATGSTDLPAVGSSSLFGSAPATGDHTSLTGEGAPATTGGSSTPATGSSTVDSAANTSESTAEGKASAAVDIPAAASSSTGQLPNLSSQLPGTTSSVPGASSTQPNRPSQLPNLSSTLTDPTKDLSSLPKQVNPGSAARAGSSTLDTSPLDTVQPQFPEAGPILDVPLLGDPLKGYGQFPLGLTAPTFGDEGYDELPVSTAEGLPEHVYFRDNTQGFNQKVEVVLVDGHLHARNTGDPTWRDVPTPAGLDGNITAISINDDALVAVDENGWMYTLSNLQSDPKDWGWIRAWGSPVWLGTGLQTPTTEEGRWSLSLIGTHTDQYYETADGKHQPVSLAKVTQVLALNEDGSKIYMMDPWLAADHSYEVGTPLNSRFKVHAISASGSVILVTNEYGDMYTRLSDFDINGSDPLQFRYTWGTDDPRPAAEDPLTHRLSSSTAPISLPADDWHHQPKVPGQITDRISVHSTGPGSNQRELRVEGIGPDGTTTGYWSKMLTDEEWTFVPTGEPLTGTLLENSAEDRSQDTLADPSPYNYSGELTDGVGITVDEFAYASPKREVQVTIGENSYPFILHTVDGRLGTPLTMRQMPIDGQFGARPAGLVESTPRNYYGAIEVPEETRAAAENDPALAEFLDGYLGGNQYQEVYLQVTPSTMRITKSPAEGVALPVVSEVSELHGE